MAKNCCIAKMFKKCQNFFVSPDFWFLLVTVIDVILSAWTFLECIRAWDDMRIGMIKLTLQRLSRAKGYIWAGALLIHTSSVVLICNGFLMWRNRKKPEKRMIYQIVKIAIYVLVHGFCFLIPYYFSEDCSKTLDYVIDHFPSHAILNLMKLNYYTGALYAYTVFSCLVVWALKRGIPEILLVENPRPRPPRVQHDIARIDQHPSAPEPAPSAIMPEPQQPSFSADVKVKPRLIFINEFSGSPNYKNLEKLAQPTKRAYNGRPIMPRTNVVTNVVTATYKTVNEMPKEENSSDLNSHPDTKPNLAKHNINGVPSKYQFIKRSLLRRGHLFQDSEFPAAPSSIGLPGMTDIVWKRPYEITSGAKFYVKGMERFDVKQGSVGNCWFVAALAGATTSPEIMAKCIPEDNDWFSQKGYCGIFHFRFFVGSCWQEVIIDDRLPTRCNELVFMRSQDKNEFWSPLLEKAYAKLKGSYGSLDGGFIRTGFINLTGGNVEEIRLDRTMRADNLHHIMKTALDKESLIGCSKHRGTARRNKKFGLLANHAYSITGIKRVNLGSDGKEPILRIRNPWGDSYEWKGDFSDNHPLWNKLDKKTRLELQLIFRSDGEFWFPIKGFTDHFDSLAICTIRRAAK